MKKLFNAIRKYYEPFIFYSSFVFSFMIILFSFFYLVKAHAQTSHNKTYLTILDKPAKFSLSIYNEKQVFDAASDFCKRLSESKNYYPFCFSHNNAEFSCSRGGYLFNIDGKCPIK